MPTRRRSAKSILRAHETYASIERRTAAHIIDLFIAAVLGFAFVMYTAPFIALAFEGNETSWVFGLIISLLYVLGFDVYFMVAYAVFSTTVGKYLFGLHVIDGAKGGDVTPMQSVVRSLSYYLSWLPLFLPFVVVFFDEPQRRALHDRLAGTMVVRDTRRRGRPGFCLVIFGLFLLITGVAVVSFILGYSS